MNPKQTKTQKQWSIEKTDKLLRKMQRKKPFYVPSQPWHVDMGRRLHNYSRVHSFLLNTYGRAGLKGKNITHFGAGNGQYMHLLAHNYGADTKAVEINLKYVKESHSRGIRPNYKQYSAAKTKIKSESQDVVLSDRFMFSANEVANDNTKMLEEAHRILKKGGILIMEHSWAEAANVPRVKELFEQIHSMPPLDPKSRLQFTSFFAFRKK